MHLATRLRRIFEPQKRVSSEDLVELKQQLEVMKELMKKHNWDEKPYLFNSGERVQLIHNVEPLFIYESSKKKVIKKLREENQINKKPELKY